MSITSNTAAFHYPCAMPCARKDVLTAQKIDVGLIFQAMLGTIFAAEYLRQNGIPLETALRVLTLSRRTNPTPPKMINDWK